MRVLPVCSSSAGCRSLAVGEVVVVEDQRAHELGSGPSSREAVEHQDAPAAAVGPDLEAGAVGGERVGPDRPAGVSGAMPGLSPSWSP